MDAIIIIDLGSQFTQLIARKIRELGTYTSVENHNFTPNKNNLPKNSTIKGIILSGGPSSVYDAQSPDIPNEILQASIPILGICYGKQLIVKKLGGSIQKAEQAEYGMAKFSVTSPSQHLVKSSGTVWMSHGDTVSSLPPGFATIGKTNNTDFAAIANIEKQIYGVQFHPEVTHTSIGDEILQNFTHEICKAKPSWKMKSYKDDAITQIQNSIPSDQTAICALSGGVDSTVAAELVFKAIKTRLHCIFINNGLLRKGEVEEVTKTFKHKLHYVNASSEFLDALSGISDPEQKRKIIGKKFIKIFEREAKNFQDATYLVQGTIYPDVIESSSSKGLTNSTVIKSHHNVGGLPEQVNLKLVEPLKMLFKDEVRKLGEELGIDHERVWRHPFPGPGLAIRILGEITREKIKILQDADHIYISELRIRNLYHKIWQAFCVLLPCKTVGVMGDARTYRYVLSLRAVTSSNGMTADFYKFDMQDLAEISTRIVNEVPGVSRVVYDITSKPPATIEWE